MLNLLRHELQSRLGAMLGWGIGLALFGAMYIAIFPEVEEQMASLADLAIYRAMGVDMTSFAGLIASIVLQFMPLVLAIYAILTSTEALAGEEDSGRLELVLALPLKRWQLVAVKAAAMAAAALVILVIAGAGDALVLRAIDPNGELDVTPGQLFGAIVLGWPLIVAVMMLGLFLGAYLPSRRTAALTLTVLFVASYFGTLLAGMVDSLEFIRPYLLFTYVDATARVFAEGPQAGDAVVLLSVAAAGLVLALLSFERRDVTVGAWPWQRAQPPETPAQPSTRPPEPLTP